MPHALSKDSSNQPDGPMDPLDAPPHDPLGPLDPPIDPSMTPK